jgi:sporulation protein YlmC with PRC-barrel domain
MRTKELARAASWMLAAAAVGLLEPSTSLAVTAPTPEPAAVQSPAVERASSLIGLPLRNKSGQFLGTATEIVLSQDGTKAERLVFLPQGAHGTAPLVYLPFNKVTRSADGKALVCDLSTERVKALPTKSELTPSWLRDVTRIIGLPVRDMAGHRVGNLRDLLIDKESGEIAAATVGTRGFLGFGARLASIEWMSVWIGPLGRYVTLNLSRDEFDRLAYSETKYWEQLGFSAPEEHMMGPKSEKDPFTPNVGDYAW